MLYGLRLSTVYLQPPDVSECVPFINGKNRSKTSGLNVQSVSYLSLTKYKLIYIIIIKLSGTFASKYFSRKQLNETSIRSTAILFTENKSLVTRVPPSLFNRISSGKFSALDFHKDNDGKPYGRLDAQGSLLADWPVGVPNQNAIGQSERHSTSASDPQV